MHRPFTLDEATDIAEDFSDLEATGLMLDIGLDTISCIIQKVAVAPFSLKDSVLFVEQYKIDGDVFSALEGYVGIEYNVLIIATNSADNTDVITLPIRDYTELYGVGYRYP